MNSKIGLGLLTLVTLFAASGSVPAQQFDLALAVAGFDSNRAASASVPAGVQTFRVWTENGRSGKLKVSDFGLIVETSKQLTNTRGRDTAGAVVREYRSHYRVVHVDRAPLQDGTVVGYEFKLPPIARGDKLIVHYTTKRPHRLPDGKVEYQDIDALWTFDHSYSGSTRILFTEFRGPQAPEFSGEWELGLVVNGNRLVSRKFTIFDPKSAQRR